MKRILLAISVILIAQLAIAQTKQKDLTEAEQFSSQAGILIEKQFIDIGAIKAIEVQVLKYKDINSGTGKSALRLEYKYKSAYTSDSKIASLDADEIDGLIKSIKNLQTNVFPTTREVYTEVTFKSRTGFEAGAYYEPSKSKWTCYVRLEKFDSNSSVYLSTEDLTSLLNLVEQAKSKM